jgi:hypothetical protein
VSQKEEGREQVRTVDEAHLTHMPGMGLNFAYKRRSAPWPEVRSIRGQAAQNANFSEVGGEMGGGLFCTREPIYYD